MNVRIDRKLITTMICITIVFIFGQPNFGNAENLAGAIGSSSKWGAGWLDLAPPCNFVKGERLELLIGGTAEKIIVRLLPKGAPPDTSAGVVGGAVNVPKSRIVEITLKRDCKEVVQISVHGGANPWGKFPLGGGNGPATIESAARINP
jgi:hypothetical protein